MKTWEIDRFMAEHADGLRMGSTLSRGGAIGSESAAKRTAISSMDQGEFAYG
jgi:hypothetical protein